MGKRTTNKLKTFVEETAFYLLLNQISRWMSHNMLDKDNLKLEEGSILTIALGSAILN